MEAPELERRVFEDLGEQLVKNIAHPVRAYRLRLGGNGRGPSEEGAPVQISAAIDHQDALELALWDSVRDGGSDELASYLEHYPEGTFASLAQTRQNVADIPLAEEAKSPAAPARRR